MQHTAKNRIDAYRFDFEIGYLIKSPCKECDSRQNFPDCIAGCPMLDKIQTILSDTVSCSTDY